MHNPPNHLSTNQRLVLLLGGQPAALGAWLLLTVLLWIISIAESGELPPALLLIALGILGLPALVLWVFAYIKAAKAYQLLRNGQLATGTGKLMGYEGRQKQRIAIFAIQYTTANGQTYNIRQTMGAYSITQAYLEQMANETWRILYHRDNPEVARDVRDLPLAPAPGTDPLQPAFHIRIMTQIATTFTLLLMALCGYLGAKILQHPPF